MEKTRRCTTATANKPEPNGCVERQNQGQCETSNRNHPRQTSISGGEESLQRKNNSSLESTSRNDIGRELDRVIEELFEVESKQGRRRGRGAALLSLWQEEDQKTTCPSSEDELEYQKTTGPPSEDELEDIDALLGNDAKDSSCSDVDDSAPFYGFPTPDNAAQTRLSAFIKTFESEGAYDNISMTPEAVPDDNQQEGCGLGCKKEEEWKPELLLTAWRKTQKA